MHLSNGISTRWLMPFLLPVLLLMSNNLAKAQYSLSVYGYIPLPATGKTSTGVDFSEFADVSFGSDIVFRYRPDQIAIGGSVGFATLGIMREALLDGAMSAVSIRRVYPVRLRVFTALAHLDYDFEPRRRSGPTPWVGVHGGVAYTEYSIVQFPNIGVLYDDTGALSLTAGIKGGIRFPLSKEIGIDVAGDYSFLFLRERTLPATTTGRALAEETGRRVDDVTLPRVTGGIFSFRVGVVYKLDI